MATWAEAEAAKRERLRREARYYTPDKRGPNCRVCKTPTDPVVTAATPGPPLHPCCSDPEAMRAGTP